MCGGSGKGALGRDGVEELEFTSPRKACNEGGVRTPPRNATIATTILAISDIVLGDADDGSPLILP